MTHICVSKLAIIGPDNGLSPDRRQAIIWTNAGILSIRPLAQWNINRNSYIFIQEMHLKMSCGKWRPFCLGRNVLKWGPTEQGVKQEYDMFEKKNDVFQLVHKWWEIYQIYNLKSDFEKLVNSIP